MLGDPEHANPDARTDPTEQVLGDTDPPTSGWLPTNAVRQFRSSVVLGSFPTGYQDVQDCLALRIARILTPDS
jgi:hypothetical protein